MMYVKPAQDAVHADHRDGGLPGLDTKYFSLSHAACISDTPNHLSQQAHLRVRLDMSQVTAWEAVDLQTFKPPRGEWTCFPRAIGIGLPVGYVPVPISGKLSDNTVPRRRKFHAHNLPGLYDLSCESKLDGHLVTPPPTRAHSRSNADQNAVPRSKCSGQKLIVPRTWTFPRNGTFIHREAFL
jgi:hypothetical protein